jgi:hypothetical protein
MDRLLVEETGKEQPQQIRGDGRNGALGRQIFAVQMIDAADARVRRDQLIRQLSDGIHAKPFTIKWGRNKGIDGA